MKLIHVLFFLIFTSNAFAYDFILDNIAYKITSQNTVYVTSGGSPSGSITIPSNVNYNSKNYIVDSIGANSFKNIDPISSVSLHSGIKSIGNSAFYNCSKITGINIP